MRIKPNDTVYAKLTSKGKEIVKRQRSEFNNRYKMSVNTEPWADNDVMGAQFHIIMSYFDGQWYTGNDLVIEWIEKID